MRRQRCSITFETTRGAGGNGRRSEIRTILRERDDHQSSLTSSVGGRPMRYICLLFLGAVYLAATGCGYIAESSFELAPESRLPNWFNVPDGMSRKDVTVKMSYYLGRKATFAFVDSNGKEIANAVGKVRDLEPLVPNGLENKPVTEQPGYEVITVGGVTELIEHRRIEPIFYISDDPKLRAEFAVPSE